MTIDLTPAPSEAQMKVPTDLNEFNSSLVIQGQHRVWTVFPRQGSAMSDKWTFLGSPIPAQTTDASSYEDGQYPSLQAAMQALFLAEAADDGQHEEDEEAPSVIPIEDGTLMMHRVVSQEPHDHYRVLTALAPVKRLWDPLEA